MADQVHIVPISTKNIDIGEGPHWLENEQALLYVGLTDGNIFKYYVKTKREQKIHIGKINLEEKSNTVIGYTNEITCRKCWDGTPRELWHSHRRTRTRIRDWNRTHCRNFPLDS